MSWSICRCNVDYVECSCGLFFYHLCYILCYGVTQCTEMHIAQLTCTVTCNVLWRSAPPPYGALTYQIHMAHFYCRSSLRLANLLTADSLTACVMFTKNSPHPSRQSSKTLLRTKPTPACLPCSRPTPLCLFSCRQL